MPILSHEAIMALRAHAVKEYPKESCGLIIDGKYHPCTNVHKKPEEHFRIHPRTMASAHKKGKVEAIIHSHPNGPFFPSEADMQGQLDTGIAWGITISMPSSASLPLMWGGDTPIAPLEGREFIHGVQDCYALVKDYYKQELGIELLDMAREDNWWASEKHNRNFYTAFHDLVGFVKVDELEPHDLILMKVVGSVANHVAVYTGGDEMLHHLAMRRSERVIGVMQWRKHMVGYYRHKSFLKEK